MAVDYFNSLGGYSAGIPAVPVIDGNGNVITNVLTTGNVTTNNIYATHYFYSNGQPFSGGGGSPGGVNTQVQFNSNGNFAGSAAFTFNSTTQLLTIANVNVTTSANLGAVGNITITGGSAGYVLSTDGAGNLSWVGSNFSPGGSNTQVQFNSDGAFAGDAGFTFDVDTGILTAPFMAAEDFTATDTITALTFQTSGNVNAGNLLLTGRANINGNLRAAGNIVFSSSPNVNLGNVGNVHITGGINGYVLTTDGTGNLSWQAAGGGGNGTPGGSNTQVQYNNNGVFGGDNSFTYNSTNQTVTIGGKLIANTTQIGSGIYKFCTSEVYFASTTSTTPSQVIFSTPIEYISGVDFHIIATDANSLTRQSSKISSIVYDAQVAFNEYAGLQINGGVGNFEVDYDAGNIIVPPSVKLVVSPSSANLTVYRVLVTIFSA